MNIVFLSLREKARKEAYEYFDQNIRKLPKGSDGEFDESSGSMWDNDADAFRHAYVSGVFTQVYGYNLAEIMGRLNEFTAILSDENERNMDFWNNEVGREYGRRTNSRKILAAKLRAALKRNELIITPADPRIYSGDTSEYIVDPNKPVLVIEALKTGRNNAFLDLVTGETMNSEGFTQRIEGGLYPGYYVADLFGMVTPVSCPDGVSENNLG